MADDTDLRLWGTIIGWLFFVFTGGIAWGKHQTRLDTHQKAIDNWGDVVTEEKCRGYHKTYQQGTLVQFENIEKLLCELKMDRKATDVRLGEMASKLDVMADRWERQNNG